MKADKASSTAQLMALFRALETSRSSDERIFYDPYAIEFLDGNMKAAAKFARFPLIRNLVERRIQKLIPGALSSGIARTKYIDDLLERTVGEGVNQLVILGAGFDTRALRLPYLQQTPVIEIDHPNTAALKMERLRNKIGNLPGHVRYLQIDFNKESFDEFVRKHSIDLTRRSTILWEGVSNYLTEQAVANVFRFVEKFSQGSVIIFTYVDQLVLQNPASFFGAERLLRDLKEMEERWTFGFDPLMLSKYLATFHLILLEDVDASAYRAKFLRHRTEKGYEFYRVALARS